MTYHPDVEITVNLADKRWLWDNLSCVVDTVEAVTGDTFRTSDYCIYNGPPWPDEQSLIIYGVSFWLWYLAHEKCVLEPGAENLPGIAQLWQARAESWWNQWYENPYDSSVGIRLGVPKGLRN